MYLTGQYYVYSSEGSKPKEERVSVNNLDLYGFELQHIDTRVGYWRKSNQIHGWFVKHCQDGEDDCRKHWISREKLTELLNLCKEVIEKSVLVDGKVSSGKTINKGSTEWVDILVDGKVVVNSQIAEELLPCSEGFFFGNDDYDEYYIEDVQDTIKIIEKALKLPESWDFYYESSW